MKPGDTIVIRRDVRYFIHPKHRGSPSKGICTWSVSVTDEVALFKGAIPTERFPGETYWSAVTEDRRLRRIGINVYGDFLGFGKFVDGSAKAVWHGYPADYQRRPQDRPPPAVLQVRVTQGLIEKHHAAKITGGMNCNL